MALQLAIAAAIGIGVMVSSFRSSVEIWLGQRLAADLYVTAPKGVAGSRGALGEQTLNTILASPDVRAASRRSVHPARWQGQPIEWAQMDFIPELKAAYPLLAGRWPAAPDEVLASEPLTVRLGVRVGQRLEVTSEGGRGLSPSPASIRITAATRGRYCMPSKGARCNPLPSSARTPSTLVTGSGASLASR